MPLAIESAPVPPLIANLRERRVRRGAFRDRGKRLRIGLVNNMPDAALAATEKQFSRLLDAASGEFDVRLTLVALDSVPREQEARAAIAESYRDPRQLRAIAPDAVIVTGAEPRASDLAAEPFWGELTALIDWTRGGVVSALYSCLAAHVAALHRDGVARQRLAQKLSGVFLSEVVVAHELTAGLTRLTTPHSRLNSLIEADLDRSGYLTLARSREAGAVVFVKEAPLLEVFWQGHPEYDPDTLAREFRRDMLRFLRAETKVAPTPPAHYFEREARQRIDAILGRSAHASLDEVAKALSPEALRPAVAAWRADATLLMQNWLNAIAKRKAAADPAMFATARWGG